MVDELLLMATGAGLTLTGGVVGYLVRPRRRPPDPQQCGCTHHLAVHDPETGECRGMVNRTDYVAAIDDYRDRWAPCPCRQYTGEKPLNLDSIYKPLPGLPVEQRPHTDT